MLVSAFLGSLLTTIGQLYANPANSAVLSTLSTVSTVIISAYVLKTKLNTIQKLAVLTIVAGAYLAVIGFKIGVFSTADLFVLSAAMFFGFNNVYSKALMLAHDSTLLASIRILIVGVGLLVTSIFANKLALNAEWAPWAFASGSLFWLVIVCLYKAFDCIGPNKAIIIANLYVVLVLLASNILFHNSITTHQVFGSIIVLVAIYFATNRKTRTKNAN
jgi:drug/metabolite transporter (DMT)-like permease